MSNPVSVTQPQLKSLAKLMNERMLGTIRIETISYRGEEFLLTQLDEDFFFVDRAGVARRFELVDGSPSGD